LLIFKSGDISAFYEALFFYADSVQVRVVKGAYVGGGFLE
jgi:hypothetical protein